MNLSEPRAKRAVAFFDGQNLYRHAKAAFGHHHPNYDPRKLLDLVCVAKGLVACGVRFYTGVPDAGEAPMWHGYWTNRLLAMRRSGIMVTSRSLRYDIEHVTLGDGKTQRIAQPREKGIDVRLALDVVRLARQGQLDVAVIFSQDQDLSEVVEEVKDIAQSAKRWIKVISAFPGGPKATSKRGINGAEWFPIDQTLYDTCIDPRDYRPKSSFSR